MGEDLRRIQIGEHVYEISSDDGYLQSMTTTFEPDMVRLFNSLVRPSDIVLDIGANIGCTSLLFGSIAKYVYAFEPSPSTFRYLGKNVAASGLRNIELMNFALGSEAAMTTLTFAPNNRAGGFVSNLTTASAGHCVEPIEVRTLDGISKATTIDEVDFVKIDVEGFEGHVLMGGREILSQQRPLVVLELNHWCLNAFQRTSVPDFFDQLRAMFPLLLAVDGEHYLNLHDSSDRYVVMYRNIVHMRFANIVAAFDENRVRNFRSLFRHGAPD